jgi:hypothetical protein
MPQRPRLGRRGTALLTFAALDVVYGLRISVLPPADHSVYAWLATGRLPLWVWSVLWISVGTVCLVYAMCQADRPAFSAAIAIKVTWAALNVLGWATGEVADGWVLATIWAAFAVCVVLLSGMEEPVARGEVAWTPPSA